MRVVHRCQDYAMLLLQVARDCPQFENQATYLAHEWLIVAAMRLNSDQVEYPDRETPLITGQF
jgi:hypothetical protein